MQNVQLANWPQPTLITTLVTGPGAVMTASRKEVSVVTDEKRESFSEVVLQQTNTNNQFLSQSYGPLYHYLFLIHDPLNARRQW